MKTSRKATPKRKPARRRSPALSLSARVERLEKTVLFKAVAADETAAITKVRFVNLGADGKPTTGEHVAVFDRTTGLTWSAGPLANGKDLNHADAMQACAELELLGHKDWRAPTVTELLALIDYKRHEPAVDTTHFKGPYGWTWTSTPYKGNPSGAAWYVFLSYGDSLWDGRYGRHRARAVRAGQNLGLLD